MALPELKLGYDEVARLLNQNQVLLDATELHGMICGLICAGALMHGKSWLDFVLGTLNVREPRQLEMFRPMLIRLYEQSAIDLKSQDFTFQPLLPTDDVDLDLRAKAVGDWCTGLMTGLDMAGVDIETIEDDDLQDAMFHLHEFSSIDYHALDYSEEDEKAYTEVVEYIRAVMFLLYQSLSGDISGGEIETEKRSIH